MTEIISKLKKQRKINCPSFIPENIVYETIMGSSAYGCNNPGKSDLDYYSICIPPMEYVFPHMGGYIYDFDSNIPKFEQYQSALEDQDGCIYDINCYGIVKFFRLAMTGNPSFIDTLYTPINLVTKITKVGTLIRSNRNLFLSKKLFLTYKGYAMAQMSKIKNKTYEHSKRKEEVDKFGFSLKYSYHLVRLMLELEQILLTGELDLQRDKEHYKAIRRGDFKLEDIMQWFNEKERQLEKLYLENKTLPEKPREPEIKQLLLNCLEEHFGSLKTLMLIEKPVDSKLLLELQQLVERYK